jgi:hypothetical protein
MGETTTTDARVRSPSNCQPLPLLQSFNDITVAQNSNGSEVLRAPVKRDSVTWGRWVSIKPLSLSVACDGKFQSFKVIALIILKLLLDNKQKQK